MCSTLSGFKKDLLGFAGGFPSILAIPALTASFIGRPEPAGPGPVAIWHCTLVPDGAVLWCQ
jgi:hypothetical protein